MFRHKKTFDWLWASCSTLQNKPLNKIIYPKKPTFEMAHMHLLFECGHTEFLLKYAKALRNDIPPTRARLRALAENDDEDDVAFGCEMFLHEDKHMWLMDVALKFNPGSRELVEDYNVSLCNSPRSPPYERFALRDEESEDEG